MIRKRRSRRTWPAWSSTVEELYDYARGPLPRLGRALDVSAEIVVLDDWPHTVPITNAELRVIEGHFAEELDELLGPCA